MFKSENRFTSASTKSSQIARNVDPFHSEADLPGAGDDTVELAIQSGLDIDVVEDDCRVVATELQRDVLDGPCRSSQHVARGLRAAGESDLAYERVSAERLTNLGVPVHDVDHPRRKDLGYSLQRNGQRGRSKW